MTSTKITKFIVLLTQIVLSVATLQVKAQVVPSSVIVQIADSLSFRS